MVCIAGRDPTPSVIAEVVIVSDDDAVQRRLCTILDEQADVRSTIATGLASLEDESLQPDLLIVHCDSIEAEHAAALERVRRAQPAMRIVTVCENTGGRRIRRAVDGAIDGVVLIDHLEAALVPTVAAVLAGQMVIPRNAGALLHKPALSFREKQVLALVALGYSNGEIAQRLFLAESTVKSHLSSAFSKLGVRSRSEAAALILDPRGSLGAGIMKIAVAAQPSRP